MRNPRNSKQISRVRLSPELIECVGFWTKNSANLMSFLPEKTLSAPSADNLDVLYMKALSRGDIQTTQKLVDEAANNAGFTLTGWHGSQSEPFEIFDDCMIGTTMGTKPKDQGFWFSSDQVVAEEFSVMSPEKKPKGWVKKFYLKFTHLAVWDRETELQGMAVSRAKKEGADGVLFKDVWDGMVVRHEPVPGIFRVSDQARRSCCL